MRTSIIITKRIVIDHIGANYYTVTIRGKYGSEFCGVLPAIPHEAAARAAEWMLSYAMSNAEGGDLVAPDEVLCLVPEQLRSIPARKRKAAVVDDLTNEI